MAGSKRPSFLKRQKEQARIARANEKREARRARKHAKADPDESIENGEVADLEEEPVAGEESEETPS